MDEQGEARGPTGRKGKGKRWKGKGGMGKMWKGYILGIHAFELEEFEGSDDVKECKLIAMLHRVWKSHLP